MADEAPTASMLYARAEKALREKHADEFVEILTAEYGAVGLVYKPRKTAEERERVRFHARKAAATAQVALWIAEFGTDIAPVSGSLEIVGTTNAAADTGASGWDDTQALEGNVE